MAHFNTSQVISHGWKVFQENWKVVVPVAIVAGVVNALPGYFTAPDASSDMFSFSEANQFDNPFGILLGLVVSAVVTLLLMRLSLRLVDGEKVDFAGAFKGITLPMVLWLIALQILAGIGIVLGFIALIVPGVILLMVWSQAGYGVAEGQAAIPALRESARITRGARLALFWFYVLSIVAAFAAIAIVGIVGALTFGLGWLVGGILLSIAAMVFWLVSAAIYRQLQATAAKEA